jgi:uncharacterized coiled-coil DUF342 family protein
MTEIISSQRLIELAVEKHNQFLETFINEFSELEEKFNSLKTQSEDIKKEIDTINSRISVLSEKYHLLFHQAKKKRQEVFDQIIDNMRTVKGSSIKGIKRMGSRIDELEKKLQTSRDIQEEERIINDVKNLLNEAEALARKTDMDISFRAVTDILDDAHSVHKELLSVKDTPEQYADTCKEYSKQMAEMEERYSWLKHRIESHRKALAYWETRKGGNKVD